MKDGGRKAVAKRVNIHLEDGNVLKDRNVVVQVKHTKDESQKSDKVIRNVFKGEEEKVRKLVKADKLETYIIVTNFKLPDGQLRQLEETFKNCGAKEVIVIGNETLTRWLEACSDELQLNVLLRLNRDDIAGLSMNDN